MINQLFNPQFNITSTILSALDDIERQIWLVDHMLLMPKHDAWIRREVQVKRAVGTTQIGGSELDEAAVRSLLRQGAVRNLAADEQANNNALQAYSFVDFLSDQPDLPIDELVVRQLNRFFLSGATDTVTPGVYRQGTHAARNYSPPDHGDVPGLMRSLATWLGQDTADVHPVVKAGIAHIQLLAIQPFWQGNGRTARAIATLVLQRSPFGFRKLLSLEGRFSQDREEYFSAIERTLGTEYRPEFDATPWLEFFALSWRQHVQEFTVGLMNWQRMIQEVYSSAADRGWTARQADGLVLAFQAGKISRPDYIDITGVSPVTASRDLAEMVEAGMLVPNGKTRARVYYPVSEESGPMGDPAAEQLPLLPQ